MYILLTIFLIMYFWTRRTTAGYTSLEGILNCSMDCYLSFTNVETLSCKPMAHKLNGIVDGTKIRTKIL